VQSDFRVPPGNRLEALSEGFFLGLQADYDLMQRRRQIAAELETISPGT
jgi:hypothetical protein